MKFYVYEHWRPDLDICFYVGKGQRRRGYRFKGRNSAYRKVLADLDAAGMCVEVRLVAGGLAEKEAFRIERERIAFWRAAGIPLTNRTDGGEGFSGFIRPKGIPVSEAAREKVSAARLGIKFTPEHRKKLSLKKIGRKRPPFTALTRARMAAASRQRERLKREKFGLAVTRWSRLKEEV